MAVFEVREPNGDLLVSSDFPSFSYVSRAIAGQVYDPSNVPIGLFTDSTMKAVTIINGTIWEYTFKDTSTRTVPNDGRASLVVYDAVTGKPNFVIGYPLMNIVTVINATQDNYQSINVPVPAGKTYGIVAFYRTVSMTASNVFHPAGPPNWEEYYSVTEIYEYLFPNFNTNSITVGIRGERNSYDSDYPVQSSPAYLSTEFMVVDLTGLT